MAVAVSGRRLCLVPSSAPTSHPLSVSPSHRSRAPVNGTPVLEESEHEKDDDHNASPISAASDETTSTTSSHDEQHDTDADVGDELTAMVAQKERELRGSSTDANPTVALPRRVLSPVQEHRSL